MFPIIQLGPLAMQTPGLIILVGIWLGILVMERMFRDRNSANRTGNLNKNVLNNLILIALLATVLGARLSYVIRYPAAFASSPMSIFSPNPGLLDFSSGLVIGCLAAFIYGRRKKLPLLGTLDALTPFFSVLSLAIHLSSLASGNAFGSPTNLPWAIYHWGEMRHPTQVYELIVSGIILWFVWPGRLPVYYSVAGRRFLVFVSASALARIIFEAFRGDSVLLPFGIRSAQVLAWLILLAGLWRLRKLSPDIGTSSTPPDSLTGLVNPDVQERS